MSHSSKSSFLEGAIGLLVQHYGMERVRTTLAKISTRGDEDRRKPPRRTVSRAKKTTRPTVVNALDLVRESDPEKYRLLSEFLSQLKERKILPEVQDISHFAQLVGLKKIGGKSRKDMTPQLMRFLLEQPTEQLRTDIQRADNISEQERQQGFSVLTDKLLRPK